MKERILRICDSYASSAGKKPSDQAVTRYELPRNGQGTSAEYRDEIVRKQKEAQELLSILNTSVAQFRVYLKQAIELPEHASSMNQVSLLRLYELFVLKQQSIYETLDKLSESGGTLMGYIWSPYTKIELERRLQDIDRAKGNGHYQVL